MPQQNLSLLVSYKIKSILEVQETNQRILLYFANDF